MDRDRAFSCRGVASLALVTFLAPAPGADGLLPAAPFVRGDADGDGMLAIADAVRVIESLFLGGGELACLDAADANDDGLPDLSDVVFLLGHLFLGGPALPPPFPGCGEDPTADAIGCAVHGPCDGTCPPAPGIVLQPALERIAEGTEGLRGGQVITLEGFDFSCVLDDHRVRFRSPRGALDGAALAVSFPGGLAAGRRSRLEVLVPTLVRSGTLELEIAGLPAGAIDYTAAPVILGFGVGPECQYDELYISVTLFDPYLLPGGSIVTLQGINFREVTEIQIEDFQGNRQILTGKNVDRGEPHPRSGLEVIRFSMQPVTVSVQTPRDNLAIRLRAGQASNTVSVPIQWDQFARDPLGPVINGLLVEEGVRRGPISLLYSFYDRPVDCFYRVRFEWSADGGLSFFPAGIPERVFPGEFNARFPAGPLCAEGAWRLFTWDPRRDDNFQALPENPSARAIIFRVQAAPAELPCPGRFDPGILFHSPPIALLDG